MFDAISILAGPKAMRLIQDEGLNLSRVKVLAGASGSAKFLVLTGIDRVLMSHFKNRTETLYLIGTSIGAFRMAAFCQPDPAGALEKLEQAYIAQQYDPRPPFVSMNQFPMRIHDLTPVNFKAALLSSGSIPLAMEGVSSIEGVPGVFRDGGILDYHLDIPFLPDADKLVLYPHFYEKITPGWFDKTLNRNACARHMENLVLIAPSEKFVSQLPFGKIPDRKDFYAFKGRDRERRAYWETVVEQNRQLGDDFFEAMESGKIKQVVKPL